MHASCHGWSLPRSFKLLRGKQHQAKQHQAKRTACSASAKIPRQPGKQPSQPAVQRPDISDQYTPANLAFLGDALWAVHVKHHYLLPRKHTKTYRALADKQVTAEMQAVYCEHLLNLSADTGFALEPAEIQLLQWAMSDQPAALRKRFRHDARKVAQYQRATALEALIGYLHLTDPVRCRQLMQSLMAGLQQTE